MPNPIVARNTPKKVELEAGKDYWWCRCGRSNNQPFCDGSHKGTGFTPRKISVDEDQEAWLCRCKHTGNQPFCDGTHKNFSDDEVGQEGPGPEEFHGGTSEKGAESGATKAPEAEPTEEEPTVAYIHDLARGGVEKLGHNGPVDAMGVPRDTLPKWDDIQVMVAQLARTPLQEDVEVESELIIGPEAKKPLKLSMPIMVSDMSFGALSEEAKTAMAKGAEMVGTGMCSGEGGVLPEEHEACSRYLYEYASAKFGYRDELLKQVQAFHFKAGQAAKTGTGGYLPGNKVTDRIGEVRGIEAGKSAESPPTFKGLQTARDFAEFSDKVREISGGIPVGFKMSANHIEKDIDFALETGADYIILDGRGGGTGAAPLLFRDHISVPTIPALARARKHLDSSGKSGKVTLIIAGGLRVPSDFIKALALGADGIALANSAMQAVGCIAARICHTNNCPSGVATQNPELRKRIDIEKSAQQVANFYAASLELMKVLARACGYNSLHKFNPDDLSTWKKPISELAGVTYSGT